MSTIANASDVLASYSTCVAPAISFEDTVRRLEACFAQLSSRSLRQQTEEDASILSAVLAYHSYRFTPAGASLPPEQRSSRNADAVALSALESLDRASKAAFVDRVLFNVDFVPVYEALAPRLRKVFPAAELEQHILERLRSVNPLHQRNALQLPYFLFRWQPDYDMSEEGVRMFHARVDELKRAPDTHPAVKSAIADAVLP